MKPNTARTVVTAPRPSISAAPAPHAEHLARQRWFSTTDQKRRNELVGSLFATMQPRVRRQLVRWGVAERDADDVCTEVFVVVMRRLPAYEGRSTISTWLFGIAQKVASDYRRSSRVQREELSEAPEHELSSTVSDEYERCERSQQVRDAVAQLKPTQRQVVNGYVLQERPMEQVARRARVPAQTAYARLYAAQSVLRHQLSSLVESAA